MFVLSFRASTLKIAAVIAALAIVIAAACWEGGVTRMAAEVPAQGSAATASAQNTDVSTNAGRIAFLVNCGWKVTSNPVEVVEVVIPETFNAVYTNYNAIQKLQGYDLSNYKGMRVKRWTYEINNYPGGAQGVNANLLIYNNKVIGGDVSSVELDGFMQGLSAKAADVKTGVKPSQADIVAETLNMSSQK